MPSGRKPVHIERAQGGGIRQRAWTWVRKQRDREWTNRDLAAALDADLETIRDYTRALALAGHIKVVREERKGATARIYYCMDRDNGVHAPRLDKQGQPVVAGRVNEAMWGTMRRAPSDWDYRELAGLASTDAIQVAVLTAKTYVLVLAAAGYLVETVPGRRGNCARPARYRLNPLHRNKPLAPMLQCVPAIYDPNDGRVVWYGEADPDAC